MKSTLLLSDVDIERAASLLRQGELVAFPTETVYGLGATIFNPMAIADIFRVKGRPSDNPLIAHLSSLAQVEELAQDIPDVFYRLADAFFPGPLTVVLRRNPRVPPIVSAGLETIALRIPAHPLARRLIEAVGEPLVAPSANLSGKPSATCAQHVLDDFQGKIGAVLDGGVAEYGIESTVVSLLGGMPLLLRPGAIPPQAIEQVLGSSLPVATHGSLSAAGSPGMKYRHYSPKVPIQLFDNFASLERELEQMDHSQILLLKRPEVPVTCSHAQVEELLSSTLYAMLRLADDRGMDKIFIYCDPQTLEDCALKNRIFLAAGKGGAGLSPTEWHSNPSRLDLVR